MYQLQVQRQYFYSNALTDGNARNFLDVKNERGRKNKKIIH